MRGNLGSHYLLMNDLDSTTAGYGELAGNTANQGRGWQPIGTSDDPFTGTLDGQGYVGIRDMLINRSDGTAMGLFAAVDGGGPIQNVRILQFNMEGDWAVGALIGENWGDVHNSCSDAGRNITAVASPEIRDPSYIWNIVDGVTYPFLSWQS